MELELISLFNIYMHTVVGNETAKGLYRTHYLTRHTIPCIYDATLFERLQRGTSVSDCVGVCLCVCVCINIGCDIVSIDCPLPASSCHSINYH